MPFKPSIHTVCGYCGVEFLAPKPSANRPAQKYCSIKCSYASRPQSVEERFWKYAVKSDGCWNWGGYIANVGYGQMQSKGRLLSAHRISWELHNGSIPRGMEVCHKCDNRACVNPEHLFLGTHLENMQDMIRKGRAKHRQVFNRRLGEDHPRSILAPTDVQKIRTLLSSGTMTQREIAKTFGVSRPTITAINNGRVWNHIPHPQQ